MLQHPDSRRTSQNGSVSLGQGLPTTRVAGLAYQNFGERLIDDLTYHPLDRRQISCWEGIRLSKIDPKPAFCCSEIEQKKAFILDAARCFMAQPRGMRRFQAPDC